KPKVLPRIPYFLCVSSLKPHKNIRTLIEASRILWNQNHSFSLALVIGTKEIPSSFNISTNEKQNINLIHDLEESELIATYQNAHAIVAPSFYEGFDYPVAEA